METTHQYAHVLSFACPKCMRPLATACNSKARNLDFFESHCRCGWSGSVLDGDSVKDWVESWSDKAPVGEGTDGSCDKSLT
jgi:hypothetical protein